jgi:hypothetical protein
LLHAAGAQPIRDHPRNAAWCLWQNSAFWKATAKIRAQQKAPAFFRLACHALKRQTKG